jgi:hypothetical protein
MYGIGDNEGLLAPGAVVGERKSAERMKLVAH